MRVIVCAIHISGNNKTGLRYFESDFLYVSVSLLSIRDKSQNMTSTVMLKITSAARASIKVNENACFACPQDCVRATHHVARDYAARSPPLPSFDLTSSILHGLGINI
jgi:hypothetical protein